MWLILVLSQACNYFWQLLLSIIPLYLMVTQHLFMVNESNCWINTIVKRLVITKLMTTQLTISWLFLCCVNLYHLNHHRWLPTINHAYLKCYLLAIDNSTTNRLVITFGDYQLWLIYQFSIDQSWNNHQLTTANCRFTTTWWLPATNHCCLKMENGVLI